MRSELQRRQSLARALLAYILAHPRSWLSAKDLRPVGGDAWRSRVVEVRAMLDNMGLTFEWNRKNGAASAYRLREKPLGRDASEPVTQVGLF